MISDRVAAVIPERSAFLRGYIEYASQCSDAPDIFHIGVGLTIFSAAVAKTARCPFMAGRSLVPEPLHVDRRSVTVSAEDRQPRYRYRDSPPSES